MKYLRVKLDVGEYLDHRYFKLNFKSRFLTGGRLFNIQFGKIS